MFGVPFSTLTWVLNRKWWHMTHQALLVWESPQFACNANSNYWLFTAQHHWNKVSYLVLGANKINKVFTIKGSAENKKNLSRVFGFATWTFPLPEITEYSAGVQLWRFFQQWLTQIGAVMFLTSSNDIKIKSAVEGCLCDDNHRFFDITNMNFFGAWFRTFVTTFRSYDLVKGLHTHFRRTLPHDVGHDIGMTSRGGK